MSTFQFVTLGNTRFVILTPRYAIKVTRIRPFFALRWLYLFLSGKINKNPDQINQSALRITIGISLAGILSNIREYLYSKKHPEDDRIFICIFSILGLIVVQERGFEINQKEFETEINWISKSLLLDLEKPEQFCRHPKDRKIRIVDYGRKNTYELLEKTLS